MNDAFLKEDLVVKKSMNNVEKVEEKRVRFTKNNISEYAADEKTDFFSHSKLGKQITRLLKLMITN